MLQTVLVILFILKLKLTRSENTFSYIRRQYDGSTLRLYRRLESSKKKWKKAQMDHDFLLYCKMSNIVPNFIKFKLYRSSLYHSDFYKSATLSLLDIEIKHKCKSIRRLESLTSTLSKSFNTKISLIDRLYINRLLRKNVDSYASSVSLIHDKKLRKLGIIQPRFLSPKDVIFNHSKYQLTSREEFLLSLGLDFCLPNFRPTFPKCFLPFELLFRNIRNLPSHKDISATRQVIQTAAQKVFSSFKTPNWFPFFKREDLNLLKDLAKNKDLVICKPDKGKGVVLLNRNDYNEKMNNILSDNTKFVEIGSPEFKLIYKTEDKINRSLKHFKDQSYLSEQSYQSLYSSGSSFSVLYGLPKIHKPGVPLRPILAAYNSPNFAIAKFLVPLLSSLSHNQYTLRNSSQFIPEVMQQNSHSYMVSFDVQSLFTNVPLLETIDIIMKRLFPTLDTIFNNFDADNFRKLLELAVIDTHFIFNDKVFKQTDGMAMGSPLGPTFANIFMCNLEELIFDGCPESFRPTFYKRYVDDTFLLFRDPSHASSFLDFINNFHPNIKFTMDTEADNKIAFLDILVTRSNNKFTTGIFRKSTFTGMGLNFFSHCPLAFKINSCKTLLFRAFSLCSDWFQFHKEISFLQTYFAKNSYPAKVFSASVKSFLDNIFKPKGPNFDVPKKVMYVSLPFSTNSSVIKQDLCKTLESLYPYVKFNFIFMNPLRLGNLFKFKDSLQELMRSRIVYQYNCPKCNSGMYVGCTKRLLRVRIDSHKGVSHRTGASLRTKEFSAIRDHSRNCKCKVEYKHFKILDQATDDNSLPLLESLYIKHLSPTLNNQGTSVPLHIA